MNQLIMRNARYNHAGSIDCEINHPVHGWIPFTADPTDSEEFGRMVHQAALDGAAGEIAAYIPPPAPQAEDDYTGRDPAYIIDHATRSVQKRLDDFAKTRNYDGILSAATYATSVVQKLAAEGQYAVNARDSSWSALYAMMGEVQAGTRAMPVSYAEVEAVLPALEWPQ